MPDAGHLLQHPGFLLEDSFRTSDSFDKLAGKDRADARHKR